MNARPITDPTEMARRLGAHLRDGVKREYRFDRATGVWRGWRAGLAEHDDLIGDYLFAYADTDGFTCAQTLSHEFVTQYPRYLPDGDHPSTVEQWWLNEMVKVKRAEVDTTPDPLLSEVRVE